MNPYAQLFIEQDSQLKFFMELLDNAANSSQNATKRKIAIMNFINEEILFYETRYDFDRFNTASEFDSDEGDYVDDSDTDN